MIFRLVNPIQATHGGGFGDGFMSKISASGSALLFSTYLGGDGDDFFQSIALNRINDDVYLSYFTDSSNFPTTQFFCDYSSDRIDETSHKIRTEDTAYIL